MSAVLPDRQPLEQPDEDARQLDDAVAAVSGAAFQLGVLSAHLTGPATDAPGWLGRDAAAAAAQVGAVTAVARGAHEALGSAADRLRRHADLLAETRHRIAVLRAEQDEEYQAASARLADALLSPASPASPYAPAHPAIAVVLGDELRAAEASRQRRHGALLADLRADAVDTARVLLAAVAGVGGTGRPRDGDRVLATLAARLPGWGDGELSARGADLARALSGPATLTELDDLAGGAAPFAGTQAFADAVLRVLGPPGVRYLLTTIGLEEPEPTSPLARLLAATLGAARPTGVPGDPVDAALGARYVDRRDPDGTPDTVVLGMNAVLAAGAAAGSGPAARTVAAWGSQVLQRERALGESAVERLPGHAGDDPVALVLDLVDRSGAPEAAAGLLSSRDAWSALLARDWTPEHGATLSAVVHLAARAPGPEGAAAGRSGLEALGEGLTREGAATWTVRTQTAATIAPALAALVGASPGALAGVLAAGGSAPAPGADDTALRGLGYLTVDRAAAARLRAAVAAWAQRSPDGTPALAGSAMGALVAAQQYGQRLAYAIRAAQLRAAAMDREFTFQVVTLPLQAIPGVPGILINGGADLLAWRAGWDGSWSIGPDTGVVFTQDDAAAAAWSAASQTGSTADTGAAVAAARASFERTLGRLGSPQAVVPDDALTGVLDQAGIDLPKSAKDALKGSLKVLERLGE